MALLSIPQGKARWHRHSLQVSSIMSNSDAQNSFHKMSHGSLFRYDNDVMITCYIALLFAILVLTGLNCTV